MKAFFLQLFFIMSSCALSFVLFVIFSHISFNTVHEENAASLASLANFFTLSRHSYPNTTIKNNQLVANTSSSNITSQTNSNTLSATNNSTETILSHIYVATTTKTREITLTDSGFIPKKIQAQPGDTLIFKNNANAEMMLIDCPIATMKSVAKNSESFAITIPIDTPRNSTLSFLNQLNQKHTGTISVQ
jgi:plastocyanin